LKYVEHHGGIKMSPQQLKRLREISELCEQGKAEHAHIKQLNEILASINHPSYRNDLRRNAKQLST